MKGICRSQYHKYKIIPKFNKYDEYRAITNENNVISVYELLHGDVL